MSAHSAGVYTATLLVMVNVKRGGGRAPSTLTSQANFTLITECTPESSGYATLCTLWSILYDVKSMDFYEINKQQLVRQNIKPKNKSTKSKLFVVQTIENMNLEAQERD